jgi:hypothetical protein
MRSVLRRMRRSFILLTTGAAIGYFFDPVLGEQRRMDLADRLKNLAGTFSSALGTEAPPKGSGPITDPGESESPAGSNDDEDGTGAGLAEELLRDGSESTASAK